ncbi:MAG: nitric oxide reductase activation protein NorD [Planctomycetota bacterium]
MVRRQAPPELHLDFAEEFFGALWKRFRKRPVCRYEEQGAHFESMAASLGAVAQAFAGRHVVVRRAEGSGGVHSHVVLLPRLIALSSEVAVNRRFLFTRAALAGAMIASQLEQTAESAAPSIHPELAFLQHAVDTACSLSKEHPGFAERLQEGARLELQQRPGVDTYRGHGEILELARRSALIAVLQGQSWEPDPSWSVALTRKAKKSLPSPAVLLFGSSLPRSEMDVAEQAMSEEEKAAGIAADASEVEAPVKDHVKRILLEDDDPYKEAMPDHAFEKISFAEKYEGGRRRMDGEDDMDEQQQSLDSVDLRELIRGGPEVHSIYKADIGDTEGIPDVASVDPKEKGITYDEWDEKARCYRRDWVTVYPTTLPPSEDAASEEQRQRLASTVRTCMRRLERKRTERRSLDRQLDGNEFDLAAVVEDHAALRSGQTPSGRIYRHNPRIDRDLATTVLLDLSLSADSWVGGRRVLDVERDAAFVLGEVAEKIGDSLQIMAYASNTRNLCRMWDVKSWHEPWRLGAARLQQLKPQGYTRIGPAIRHATASLEAHDARHKHLILITDAKPTDFDRYEGNYGVHDVRQAVREAASQDIGVHALGIDPKCAGILPVMFGVRGWKLLPHLAELPEALVNAYGDLC